MTTKFKMTRDINGYNGFGLKFADDNYDTVLLASVEQTLTVPDKFNKAVAIFAFEPGSLVWVANNKTATVPGAAFAATDSQLNPIAREVAGGDILHFITTNANADVSVAIYDIAPTTGI